MAWLSTELLTLSLMWQVDLPKGPAFEKIIATLAKYPRHLVQFAFDKVADEVEQPFFLAGRFPAPGTFTRHIRSEMEALQATVRTYADLELRLSTIRLKAAWDREARERRARLKATEH
jgi:hypothetical protein